MHFATLYLKQQDKRSFLSLHDALTPSLIFILLLGILLPLPPLVANPLHSDEALYAYWAKLIASGEDPMLNTVPLDKPPLFIYSLAVLFIIFGPIEIVARFISFTAHLIILSVTYHLGRKLYHPHVGFLAALLVALSPYSILFAPTILTDPLMVAFVLLAVWAACFEKASVAGLSLGLAIATKQQGIFFIPLILGFLVKWPLLKIELNRLISPCLSNLFWKTVINALKLWLSCLLTTSLGLLLPLLWDTMRTKEPGFWPQSVLSYGSLDFQPDYFQNRFLGYLKLLHLATDSHLLNLILLVGLPLLLSHHLGLFQRLRAMMTTGVGAIPPHHRQTDWLLSSFSLGFLVLHALFSFQIWDRYLLGLIPFLAMLLARILHLISSLIQFMVSSMWHMVRLPSNYVSSFRSYLPMILLILLLISLMIQPVQRAMLSTYPLGGDQRAYWGTADVVAYMQAHVGANTTLYHRWLGTHWRYYFFQAPYDLRYWQSAPDLARQAQTTYQRKANQDLAGQQYIAFPAWRSMTLVELALSDVGLSLKPVFQSFQPNGTPAIYLYRLTDVKTLSTNAKTSSTDDPTQSHE